VILFRGRVRGRERVEGEGEGEERQMPPTASPGVRGTQTELTANSLVTLTPRTAGSARKMMPLVSWFRVAFRLGVYGLGFGG